MTSRSRSGVDEIVALIGTNGAGKTTIMNAIGGYLPASGAMTLLGRDVSGAPRCAHGPAGPRADVPKCRPVPRADRARDRRARRSKPVATPAWWRPPCCCPEPGAGPATQRATPTALVDFLGLGRYAGHYIADLSTGTRRIVELAGLLALGARVLCLDEPTAGVAQKETEAFAPLIVEIRRELEASVLLVEHDMPLVMGISDRIYCLEAGAVIADGTPGEVRNDPLVIASYLGTDRRHLEPDGSRSAAPRQRGIGESTTARRGLDPTGATSFSGSDRKPMTPGQVMNPERQRSKLHEERKKHEVTTIRWVGVGRGRWWPSCRSCWLATASELPASAGGSTPGVSKTTIKIGVSQIDLSSVVQYTSGLTQGDFKGAFTALIANLNKKGGINGRKVVPTFVNPNPLQSSSAAAACTQLTEDDNVFAVIGQFYSTDPQCYVAQHATPVVGGTMTNAGLAAARAPWFTAAPNADVLEPAAVAAAAKAGVFKGKTVGVLSYSGANPGVFANVVATLRRSGVTPKVTATAQANAGDPAATFQQVSGVFVPKFQTAGVNVLVAIGEASTTWVDATGSGTYHPLLVGTNYPDMTAAIAGRRQGQRVGGRERGDDLYQASC